MRIQVGDKTDQVGLVCNNRANYIINSDNFIMGSFDVDVGDEAMYYLFADVIGNILTPVSIFDDHE